MKARPCNSPGCGALITRAEKGYCDDHKDMRTGWFARPSQRTGSTTALKGRPWRRLREATLLRDQYLCQNCASNGRLRPAEEVDHVIPIAQGGSDDPDNLQSLCRSCHLQKTLHERNSTKEDGREIS